MDLGPTDEVDEDQGPDPNAACRALLDDMNRWPCLDSTDCTASESCTPTMTCELPPCWGSCIAFPGVCLMRSFALTCTKAGDCPTGQGCAGASADGAVPVRGSCRALPSVAGACWSDLDCTEGLHCTGETRCDVNRLGTCTEHPGRCGPVPSAGSCLDDGDCGNGSWCKGATLCALGDNGCADLAGTCEAGNRPGCMLDADCAAGEDGPFCVGAGPDHAGTCTPAPQPNNGECWDDEKPCGTTEACLGTAPCPPGDRCRAGGMHAGYCGPFPPQGMAGIEITYTGKAETDPEGVAVIRNGLPVAIVFSPCYALGLQVRKNDETWPDLTEVRGQMDDATCNPDGAPLYLRLPPGGTRVLVGLQVYGVEATTNPFRLVLQYLMGCDTQDPAVTGCRVSNAFAFSAEFP
jgi:hypothetical protein